MLVIKKKQPTCYELGKGIEKNSQRACQLYELSAHQGNMRAQYALGYAYFQSTSPNPKKAFHYFKLSARQGFSNAEHALAVCYQNGYGIKKNLKQAMIKYKLGIIKGNSASCYNFIILNFNQSRKKKQKINQKFLKLAVQCLETKDKKTMDSQYLLGRCYEEGFILCDKKCTSCNLFVSFICLFWIFKCTISTWFDL